MNARTTLVLGALLGALGVALGAYHAHGLEGWLTRVAPPDQVAPRLARAHTAVVYQLFHALALVAVAALAFQRPSRALRVSALLFVVGTGLFSGGLYLLAFSGRVGHWAIVPSGGLCLIAGWVALALHGVWRAPPPAPPDGRTAPRLPGTAPSAALDDRLDAEGSIPLRK